jgi:hypothetical protein
MNSYSLTGWGGLATHPEEPSYWSGVIAMSLCVFALVASEFMPVSLLTPIADDPHFTQGMAGQGIAISGAFAGLTSLSIARTLDRKILLLAMTLLMGVSVAVVGFALTTSQHRIFFSGDLGYAPYRTVPYRTSLRSDGGMAPLTGGGTGHGPVRSALGERTYEPGAGGPGG